jgi:hypothetical protein
MARTKSPKKSEAAKEPTTTAAPVVKAQESIAATPTASTPTTMATPATAPTAITSAEPRRLEIVKPEARASVVPINLEDEIRKLAYELSARRGFEAGHEREDWLAAESEIRQRYHQRSA